MTNGNDNQWNNANDSNGNDQPVSPLMWTND